MGTQLPDDRKRSKFRIITISTGAITLLLCSAVAVYLVRPAHGAREPIQASTEATPAPEATPQVSPMPVRMTRPDKPYVITAYFEEHQAGDETNADVLLAIKLAAEEAKKTGLSLVVTCHGDDAVPGNPKATEDDFKLSRFVTIRDDLIEQGITENRIKNGWNDPALTAETAKDAPKSTAKRPNCYIETAVPTSLD